MLRFLYLFNTIGFLKFFFTIFELPFAYKWKLYLKKIVNVLLKFVK